MTAASAPATPTGPPPLSRGVWGVLATPFAGPALDLDEESLAREVAFYRDLPATGLVALGVFGEAAKLDVPEQRRVLRTVCGARGDLPVVVGLTGQSTAPVVEQAVVVAEEAADALAGLMVQVNGTDPEALARHLRAVHEATGAGIVVQDYPVVSGVRIAPERLAEAVAACPFVVAVKAEAPPTPVAVAKLASPGGPPVFGGLGGLGLIDELAAGASGAMTGFSYPEGLRAAVDAFDRGGFDAARRAFSPWLPLVTFEAQAGIGLAIRKEILRRRGLIAESGIRSPGAPLPAELLDLLEHHVTTAAEVAA